MHRLMDGSVMKYRTIAILSVLTMGLVGCGMPVAVPPHKHVPRHVQPHPTAITWIVGQAHISKTGLIVPVKISNHSANAILLTSKSFAVLLGSSIVLAPVASIAPQVPARHTLDLSLMFAWPNNARSLAFNSQIAFQQGRRRERFASLGKISVPASQTVKSSATPSPATPMPITADPNGSTIAISGTPIAGATVYINEPQPPQFTVGVTTPQSIEFVDLSNPSLSEDEPALSLTLGSSGAPETAGNFRAVPDYLTFTFTQAMANTKGQFVQMSDNGPSTETVTSDVFTVRP